MAMIDTELLMPVLAALANDETEAKQLLGRMTKEQDKQLLQAIERLEDWIADIEGWYEPLSAEEVEKRVRQRTRDPLLVHVQAEIDRERERERERKQ